MRTEFRELSLFPTNANPAKYTNFKGKSRAGDQISADREIFFKFLISQNDWKIVFCFHTRIQSPIMGRFMRLSH